MSTSDINQMRRERDALMEALEKAVRVNASLDRTLVALEQGFRRAQTLRSQGRKREANLLFDSMTASLSGLTVQNAPGESMKQIVNELDAGTFWDGKNGGN